MDTKAIKPPKINKIAGTSVRDIHRIDLIKIKISQSIFKISHVIFGIGSELNFDLIVGGDF